MTLAPVGAARSSKNVVGDESFIGWVQWIRIRKKTRAKKINPMKKSRKFHRIKRIKKMIRTRLWLNDPANAPRCSSTEKK